MPNQLLSLPSNRRKGTNTTYEGCCRNHQTDLEPAMFASYDDFKVAVLVDPEAVYD